MPNIDKAIKWFRDKDAQGITYSMEHRRGPRSYDCSSAVYYALIQGGFFPKGIYIGNTETEFGDLEKHGWVRLPEDKNGNIATKKGDIFIWGRRGASSGAFGHTGIFVNSTDIIHCSFGYNGINVDNHDWLYAINGNPANTIYRYAGKPTAPAPSEPVDQVVNPGSYIKFPNAYRVDAVKNVADIWQVRSNKLCPIGFTWADNGIPAGPVVEVDNDGYKTPDQSLERGSKFKIPGKFKVLDVGKSDGRWLGQIQMAGFKLWVDLAPVTEVGSKDAGTPVPPTRPKPAPAPKPPKSDPEPEPVPVPVPTPEEPQPEPVPEPMPEPSPEPKPQPEEPVSKIGLLDVIKSIVQFIKDLLKNLKKNKGK
tara:strand:+ start:2634 stop:3728 length:1095 start_codon:yes stop_codon:yes gene_type:complete